VRTSFSQAFRQSFRPLNVREDLASLPWIAVHTKALWLPLLITFGSTVYIVATGGNDTISEFMFAYFIQTPAIGSVFLAGFLAPRSSWLLGAIIGFLSAICYGILIVAFPTMIPGAAALPTDSQAREVVISALILSPIIGSFFAAGAAWYRRFLAMSSPNRQRKASQTPKQKPGDGRTRTGSTQKAGAKR
jgi:phosphate/sulfate permease